MAKRKTLFDDRPVEISVRVPLCCPSLPQILKDIFKELTFVIKQDIASINKQIATLQADVKQRKAQSGAKSAEEKQVEEHNNNVVMLLQNKLADTSMTFKDVLEIRTQVRSNYLLSGPYDFSNICSKLEHERIEGSDRTVHVLCSSGSKPNAIKSVWLLMWCPLTRLKLAHFRLTSILEHTTPGFHGRRFLWPT